MSAHLKITKKDGTVSMVKVELIPFKNNGEHGYTLRLLEAYTPSPEDKTEVVFGDQDEPAA